MDTRFRVECGEYFGTAFVDFRDALKDAQRWNKDAKIVAVILPRWI